MNCSVIGCGVELKVSTYKTKEGGTKYYCPNYKREDHKKIHLENVAPPAPSTDPHRVLTIQDLTEQDLKDLKDIFHMYRLFKGM